MAFNLPDILRLYQIKINESFKFRIKYILKANEINKNTVRTKINRGFGRKKIN